ncbi:MAG TPA: GntR family transcriptional regulator [Phycisphaerae bacterium]|nr:GntR family transcriptional regulator [Phycisphaerae bacterium]
MLLRIDPSSGIPITRQVIDQIRARCAGGILKAGDRLPSVRELARQLAINQNTILKAYERLAAEGIIDTRHGEGSFVAEFAAGKQLKRERAVLEEDLERVLRHALVLGLSESDLQALFQETLDRIAPRDVAPTRRSR